MHERTPEQIREARETLKKEYPELSDEDIEIVDQFLHNWASIIYSIVKRRGPGAKYFLNGWEDPQHIITDTEWTKISLLLSSTEEVAKSTGRPKADCRNVLEGILWYLNTDNSRWVDMPEHYPPHKTCYRYYSEWKKSGVLSNILELLDSDTRL